MSTNQEAAAAGRTAEAGDPAVDGPGLERLLSIVELSEYLDVPVATIYDWRVDGKGPRALRVGRHLRFSVGDVQAWLTTLREPAPGQSGSSGW